MPLFIAFEKHTAVVGGVQLTLLAGQTISDADYSIPALTAAGFKFGPVVTGGPNTNFLRQDGAWSAPSGGGGGGLPPDGNYGDIIVGASGTSWQIAAGVVGTTELADANVTTAKIADANVTNAKLAADAVTTVKVADDAITYAKLQNVSATDKVLGRATAGAGNVEEIDCTAAGRALLDDANAAAQRTTLGLGALATKATVATADIDNDAVTYAKIQNVTTARLLGRLTAGSGDAEELAFSGFDTSGGTIAVPNSKSSVIYPVFCTIISASGTVTVSSTGSLSCRAFYYGKAPKALTSVVVMYRVTTAGSGFTWAELAIGRVVPTPGGPNGVVYHAHADVSGVWTSTGVKQTTISGLTIAAGDDIWLIWAKASTASPIFRAAGVGDDLQTGLQCFADGNRPSGGLSPSYVAEATGSVGIWAPMFI